MPTSHPHHKDNRHEFAWWVGMIINPLVLPLPLPFLMARHADAPTIELTRIIAMALFGYLVVLFAKL